VIIQYTSLISQKKKNQFHSLLILCTFWPFPGKCIYLESSTLSYNFHYIYFTLLFVTWQHSKITKYYFKSEISSPHFQNSIEKIFSNSISRMSDWIILSPLQCFPESSIIFTPATNESSLNKLDLVQTQFVKIWAESEI
jgi:hypothetical protein